MMTATSAEDFCSTNEVVLRKHEIVKAFFCVLAARRSRSVILNEVKDLSQADGPRSCLERDAYFDCEVPPRSAPRSRASLSASATFAGQRGLP